MKNSIRFLLAKLMVVMLVASGVTSAQQKSDSRDFSKEAPRSSPDWVKDAVIYEIFPRNYSQKGDFSSITKDLDRLKDLGVTVLWLMPIHPIGQEKKKGTIGSPYAVRDYYAINPDYGTADDLKRLVSESHKRGLKVIIDIVANHTSWDSVLMKNKGFHMTNDKGEIISPVADWADVADLNYDKPEVRKYMTEMLKYWVREFDLDGFRCDVAFFVPTDFWENARAEVDKIKPDTIWLAEAESPDLLTKAFDLDYAWEMHAALDRVFHGDAPASEIRRVWESNAAKYQRGALRMRFSDNHDERRAIARFGEKGAIAAQSLAFTLDGVPMIYNGMEAGDTTESGFPALFEKMPVFWDSAIRRPQFPQFYKHAIKIRRDSVALRRGDLRWLRNSDESRILTFARKSGGEEIVVAINASNAPFMGTVEMSGAFEEIAPNTSRQVGLPALALDSFGVRIFRRMR